MKYLEILEKNNLDAYWITDDFNKRYLTNFTGSTSEVILTKDGIIFISDGRYTTQLKSELDVSIKIKMADTAQSYFEALSEILKQYKKVGFEANNTIFSMFDRLNKELPNVELIPINGGIETLRMQKEEYEIDKIRKAVEITDKAFSYILTEIKPGMTEIEVKLLLENKQIKLGAKGSSFETIIAAGVNSAKPHARPSTNVIKEGDIVTIDFGCYYEGYCSDMTRTFFVGKATNEELINIHNIVQQAAKIQIEEIKPGLKCLDIDKIGRDYITEKGYGKEFCHGTGHGIGLDIHEEPYLTVKGETVLQPGMVVTVEPGIYVEGLGGVRIEQDILVTKEGYEILNKSNTSYDAYNQGR